MLGWSPFPPAKGLRLLPLTGPRCGLGGGSRVQGRAGTWGPLLTIFIGKWVETLAEGGPPPPRGGALSELGGAVGNGEWFSPETGAEWERTTWEGGGEGLLFWGQ